MADTKLENSLQGLDLMVIMGLGDSTIGTGKFTTSNCFFDILGLLKVILNQYNSRNQF